MQFSRIQRALVLTYKDVSRHHTMQVAAALSYYSILSIFPGLIFLSAVLSLLLLGNLFSQLLTSMSQLLPADTMRVVRSVLHEVLSSHRRTWLSFGMLGIIWSASSIATTEQAIGRGAPVVQDLECPLATSH